MIDMDMMKLNWKIWGSELVTRT